MTFGQIIQRILDKHALTQEQAAAKLGVARHSVNQLVNDRRMLTPDMAVRFERAKLGDAEILLQKQMRLQLDAARKGMGT